MRRCALVKQGARGKEKGDGREVMVVWPETEKLEDIGNAGKGEIGCEIPDH
jgi:hypothetical protein